MNPPGSELLDEYVGAVGGHRCRDSITCGASDRFGGVGVDVARKPREPSGADWMDSNRVLELWLMRFWIERAATHQQN